MKYAIVLLLGVSAWGQTAQQMKEQFPPMPPACMEETEHGWRSIVCPDVSQNAPLASGNQSPDADPRHCYLVSIYTRGSMTQRAANACFRKIGCPFVERAHLVKQGFQCVGMESPFTKKPNEFLIQSVFLKACDPECRKDCGPCVGSSKPVAKKKAVSK